MPGSAGKGVSRVVVFVQENKTPDFYFPSLAAWGAEVTPYGPLLEAAPDFDQPHDRNAWVHYTMGDFPAVELSIDNDALIPYHSWLAKSFTFCDHHFGAGTNSTAGHLMTFTGQTPTFRNPPFTGPHPVWDVPTVFRLAERGGRSWGAFVDQDGYPAKLVAELADSSAGAHIHGPGGFANMAHAGTLPDLCYVWSPAGYDEHPPHMPRVHDYLAKGQDLIWQEVDAVVAAGGWDETLFLLTWDDWGGYADHVTAPSIETLPDALHADGFTAIGGSRIPLICFGGKVTQGIDYEWHSHASIIKTVIDTLSLSPLGVPRVDNAPSMLACVDPSAKRPAPPAYGATITQPAPPARRPTPRRPARWPGPLNQPMSPILLNGGGTLPPPSDGAVHPKPPHLPRAAQRATSGSGSRSQTGTRSPPRARPAKRPAKKPPKKR